MDARNWARIQVGQNDLQIRGGGNLLVVSQSGHIAAGR
jgi:transcription-repair coupling factor (superfamily II helicase)